MTKAWGLGTISRSGGREPAAARASQMAWTRVPSRAWLLQTDQLLGRYDHRQAAWWPRDSGGLGSISHLLTHCFVWALDQRVPAAAAYPAARPPPAPAAGLPLPTLPPGLPAPGPLSAPATPSSRGRFFSTVPFRLCVSTRWPLSSSSFGAGTFSPGHSLRGGVMTGK